MIYRICRVIILCTVLLISVSPIMSCAFANGPSEVINNFAFKAAEIIGSASEGDFFFSPYSIISAFGMVYAGASGQTAVEMQRALSFSPDIHKQLGELTKDLSNENALSSANRVWLSIGTNLCSSFMSVLSKDYDSDAARLDFRKEPERAKDIINEWVSSKTNNKIKDLLQTADPDTQMILTNAVYFNARWAKPFNRKLTMLKPFYIPGSALKHSDVPMMIRKGEFLYGELDGNKLLHLPYDNHRMSMLVVLPPEGSEGYVSVFKNLNMELFSQWLKSLSLYQVDIWLPKFKTEKRYELKNIFNTMGIRLAFENEADFSGMTQEEKVKLDAVIHKTFIEVDEEKTEAAAATAIGIVKATALPRILPEAEFHADRPFVYFIIDDYSGTILFVGYQTFM